MSGIIPYIFTVLAKTKAPSCMYVHLGAPRYQSDCMESISIECRGSVEISRLILV